MKATPALPPPFSPLVTVSPAPVALVAEGDTGGTGSAVIDGEIAESTVAIVGKSYSSVGARGHVAKRVIRVVAERNFCICPNDDIAEDIVAASRKGSIDGSTGAQKQGCAGAGSYCSVYEYVTREPAGALRNQSRIATR